MKADKTSRTAQYMALFRALETTRKKSERLFTDVYAAKFLDNGLRFATGVSAIPVFRKYVTSVIHKKIPGAFSSGLARTKHIDNLLKETIADGIQQVIILGAGFDTRAMRLDFMHSIPVIEIDHPNTSNYKIEKLKKYFGKLPENIIYCQIDFNKQNLSEIAEKNKFDFTKPTTIIWEGVTNYLSEEAIDSTFSFITRFSKNSYVIFTYVHQKVLTEPTIFFGAEKLLKDLKNIEERWTFGLLPEKLSEYLSQFGFILIDDMGAEEYRNKYLPERTERGYEFYRIAIGKKL